MSTIQDVIDQLKKLDTKVSPIDLFIEIDDLIQWIPSIDEQYNCDAEDPLVEMITLKLTLYQLAVNLYDFDTCTPAEYIDMAIKTLTDTYKKVL